MLDYPAYVKILMTLDIALICPIRTSAFRGNLHPIWIVLFWLQLRKQRLYDLKFIVMIIISLILFKNTIIYNI